MKLFENTKTTLLVAAVAMLATACNDNLYDERHSKEFKGEAPGYITGIDFVKNHCLDAVMLGKDIFQGQHNPAQFTA